VTEAVRSELQLRVMSAIAMAAVAIGTAWLGGPVFATVWTIIALVVLKEWVGIVWPDATIPVRTLATGAVFFLAMATYSQNYWLAFIGFDLAAVSVAFSASGRRKDIAIGLVYAGALAASVIACRGHVSAGMIVIFWLFASVWGTDTLAYFTGRALGGPKLWPAVSPKKTWSGAIGGLVGAILLSYIVFRACGLTMTWFHVALTLAFSVATQAGDLFESSIKRRFGVKDSGSIIPGHGGAMDRLDGFIFAVAVALICGLILSGGLAGVPAALLGRQGM
jgi:phosphatidate cytidylyltransferase